MEKELAVPHTSFLTLHDLTNKEPQPNPHEKPARRTLAATSASELKRTSRAVFCRFTAYSAYVLKYLL